MNNWEQCNGWFSLSLPNGAAIVELHNDGRWFWQVDKEDGDMVWTDEIYNTVELPGWWGFSVSQEEAQQRAEQTLRMI